MCPQLPRCHPHISNTYIAGLHGARLGISGRRQDVLDAAVAALKAEGVTAMGLQVCEAGLADRGERLCVEARTQVQCQEEGAERRIRQYVARFCVSHVYSRLLPPNIPKPASPSTGALPQQGDVRSSDACEGWVAALGAAWGPALDVLVNCAAGNFLATSEELSVNGFKTGA